MKELTQEAIELLQYLVKHQDAFSDYFNASDISHRKGGGKEENETIEECVKREINEEFNLDVEVKEFLGKVEDDKNIGYIYNAKIIGGTLKLGGEELEHNNEENYYEVRKLKVSEIDKYDILEENKELIRKAYNNK